MLALMRTLSRPTYENIINGSNGPRRRQGEKVVGLCRKVWRIMRRLHPELFDKKHPNPWDDFTLKSRTKRKKHAVTREEVYKFAWGCMALIQMLGRRSHTQVAGAH